jgi:hypothetical protein
MHPAFLTVFLVAETAFLSAGSKARRRPFSQVTFCLSVDWDPVYHGTERTLIIQGILRDKPVFLR